MSYRPSRQHQLQTVKLQSLRQAVTEAWEAVVQDQLEELIDSMHDRRQAVIDTKGMHTK